MTERTSYLFRVDRIERRSRQVYVSGKGAEAVFASQDLGWFVTCGSVTFGVGEIKPDLAIGDTLELRKREP